MFIYLQLTKRPVEVDRGVMFYPGRVKQPVHVVDMISTYVT